MFNVMWLIVFAWIAVFTSQSLVDAADILIFLTVLKILFSQKKIKELFKIFDANILWCIWLLILFAGLVPWFQAESYSAFKPIFEFKWIFSFLCLTYLLVQIDLEKLFMSTLPFTLAFLNTVALILFVFKSSERAGGILDQVMAFSHNIGPTFILFALILIFNIKELAPRIKLLLGYVAVTSGVLTVLTITRGVWIGVFVSLMLATLIWNRKIFLVTLVGFFLVVVASAGFSSSVRERLTQNPFEAAGSNYIRRALIKANWEIVKDHPIVGVGLGNNKKILPEKYLEMGGSRDFIISHAHNQYLEFLATTGVLGLFCYLFFIFKILKISLFTYKNSQNFWAKYSSLALGAAALCFVVGGLTECNFNVSKNRYFFLVLSASIVALAYQSAKNEYKTT